MLPIKEGAKINQPKILIIPHTSTTNVKVRALELAKGLVEEYEIFYLTCGQREGEEFTTKIKYAFSELLRTTSSWKEGQITFVRLPTLYRPFFLVKYFNRFFLKRLIKRYSFDLVYSSSSYLFSFPANVSVPYVFDLADDHAAGCEIKNPRQAEYIRKFTEAEISRASCLTAISESLQRLLKERYRRESVLIPNGADIKAYSSVKLAQTEELKGEFGLSDRCVIGAIGNHGQWSGLEFLIRVFQAFKKEMPESSLFIVGPGSEVERLAPLFENDADIVFTGPKAPEEMPVYFSAVDVGVLPFDVNKFTNSAIPIKIIEYSAARKPVVSTPLEGIKSLGFQNVFLAEQEIEPWIVALKKAMQSTWKEEWDKFIVNYDWSRIVETLKNKVFRKLAGRNRG